MADARLTKNRTYYAKNRLFREAVFSFKGSRETPRRGGGCEDNSRTVTGGIRKTMALRLLILQL